MAREHIVSVTSIDLSGLPGRLADSFLLWRERSRQRRQLAQMDGRLLRDIGLSRAQALTEAEKPFWRA